MIKANVAPAGAAAEQTFNDWWAYEHMPEYVARDGFHRGWRLRRVEHETSRGDQGQRYLAIYEIDAIPVFSLALRECDPPWGPWQQFVDDWLLDWQRTYYRVCARHQPLSTPGACWVMVKSDLLEQRDGEAFREWYATTHIPAVCSFGGVHRAWLLEAERDPNELGPVDHRFCAVYEVESPDAFAAARAARLAGAGRPWDEWHDRLRDWSVTYYDVIHTVSHEEALTVVGAA